MNSSRFGGVREWIAAVVIVVMIVALPTLVDSLVHGMEAAWTALDGLF